MITQKLKDKLIRNKPALLDQLYKIETDHSSTLVKQASQLSADEFLAEVTKDLRIGVKELLRLGIITQQDITDLENGMYGFEHINAYWGLVEQQLTLRLASDGKDS